MLDSLRLAHAGAARNADFVSPYLLGDSGMPGDTATTLAALYRASRSLAPSFASTFPMTTFLELQSTGRLGLIQDPGVRAALLHYYREIAATGVNLDLLPREYRDFIRRRLPTAIQLSVRSECPVQGTAQNEPLQCSIPLGDFDPRPLLREVEGNVSLAGDLNFSRQQLAIGLGLQAALIERTDELAELVIAAR